MIFDVGGVLLVSGEPVARRRWEQDHGLASGELDRMLADAIGPGWKGGRAESEIWSRLEASLVIDATEVPVLREALFAHEEVEPTLADFMKSARQSYRLGIITNNGPDARADFQRRFQLCDSVDCFVVSAEEGVEKPDAEIFRIAASRLGVRPDRCIFIDDSPRNVAGAEAVGMTGIVHAGPAATIDRLRSLLGLG
jgi:epoxide hydrolase-like predicted phosphatase